MPVVTQYAEWQDMNQVLSDHTEQPLGPTGTRTGTAQPRSRGCPRRSRRKLDLQPLGLQRAKVALGFRSGKALSLRVCALAVQEILAAQNLPGGKGPRGPHYIMLTDLSTRQEQGEQPFSCQTSLSKGQHLLCCIRFHIHLC